MPPTFVLVPGAWHRARYYDLVIEKLEHAGYSSQAVQLPTLGTTKSMSADTAFLRQVFEIILEGDQDIIVVLHSYSAFPGSTAIKGLGKEDRGESRSAIIGLVYLSAFVPLKNASLEDMCGGTLPPWQDVNESTGMVGVFDPRHLFYEDVEEPLATEAVKAFELHSLKPFREGAGPVGYTDASYEGRRAYIRTTRDTCFSEAGQDANINGSGVDWDIISMATSHSPFLSAPAELAGHLTHLAQNWT